MNNKPSINEPATEIEKAELHKAMKESGISPVGMAIFSRICFELDSLKTQAICAKTISAPPETSCRCGAPGIEEHTCPFAEDVCGDHESLCNCCASCQHECAMDV